MNVSEMAMGLMRDGVPLSLLIDVSGLGVSSEQLLHEEESQGLGSRLVAVGR